MGQGKIAICNSHIPKSFGTCLDRIMNLAYFQFPGPFEDPLGTPIAKEMKNTILSTLAAPQILELPKMNCRTDGLQSLRMTERRGTFVIGRLNLVDGPRFVSRPQPKTECPIHP